MFHHALAQIHLVCACVCTDLYKNNFDYLSGYLVLDNLGQVSTTILGNFKDRFDTANKSMGFAPNVIDLVKDKIKYNIKDKSKPLKRMGIKDDSNNNNSDPITNIEKDIDDISINITSKPYENMTSTTTVETFPITIASKIATVKRKKTNNLNPLRLIPYHNLTQFKCILHCF